MRPLRALGIYAAVVFIGGALLAPWVFRLVQNLSQLFPQVQQAPFQRFVGNTMLVIALAGLWPLFRALGAVSLREIGLTNPIQNGNRLMGGFMLGLCSMGIIVALALAFGAREFQDNLTVTKVVSKLSRAVLTAVVVALLEETLFRGGVFGGLRRVFQWPFALLVSSMIFSLTHFLQDAKHEGPVTWMSGLEFLPRMFGADVGWAEAPPRFLNLTLIGVLLALAYQRTGNLWFSISLHASWIFWLVAYRALTHSVPGVNAWFWGSRKIVDGWMALPVLAFTLFFFARFPLTGQTDSVRDKRQNSLCQN